MAIADSDSRAVPRTSTDTATDDEGESERPPLPENVETVATDAGTLVYRPVGEFDRGLAGFLDDVDDWNAMRDELARRGHGTGAIHHKPVFKRE